MAYATATTSNTSYRFVVSTVDIKDESSLTDVINELTAPVSGLVSTYGLYKIISE